MSSTSDVAAKPLFFDRTGTPIGQRAWMELRNTPGYKFLARDTVTTCDGDYMVVTAWLGTDQGSSIDDADTPLIFGTIARVCSDESQAATSGWVERSERFSATEAAATEAHDALCAELIAGEFPPASQ